MQEVLPFGPFNTSINDVYVANLYYRLEKPAKGDATLNVVSAECFEKIRFYVSMGGEFAKSNQHEISVQKNTLKSVIDIAKQANRNELANEVENQMKVLLGNFAS
jgi:hypothetical protein